MGLIAGCASNRYALKDNTADKHFLEQYIAGLEKEGKVTSKPLMVVDGIAFGYNNQKESKIQLKKSDIFRLSYLSKDSAEAVSRYGIGGKAGVLMIQSKQEHDRLLASKPLTDSKVLFFNGDRKLTAEEVKQINPNDIFSIDVIKNKESIRKYSSEDLDGVILIKLKKDVQEQK